MWILPKQLISAFAQDTEALTLDSVELSQTCAQSLMRRSKPSPAKTYLREWKAGSLMRLRSGAISSRFLGQSFLGWWTYSLAATRVSHSAQPASEPEQMTQGTSGHLSQVEFKFYDPDCVSSRMWKDTLALDSERSLQTWKALVIKRRGEYSRRLNAARLTSAKECSSWPSPVASEVRQGFQDRSRGMKGSQESLTTVVLKTSGPVDPANHNTHGSRPELLWPTHTNTGTGRVSDGKRGRDLESCITNPQAWATPRVGGEEKAETRIARGKDVGLHGQVKSMENGMKLNSRWAEVLMGLPVGWTMPSCASPVTIAQTNCDCLATESSQQQQP